ncbi:site-2 protease family protein [Cohnella sp. GCM10020058]|uniref:site-2 protease family protein n=1 Tax=Cohnella sp. GCM10020058 TaxID=3317330 RepID=UPI00363DF66E
MLDRLTDPVIWQVAIGVALSVLVHEVGHAFIQRCFRLPVHLIEWGRGPRIVKLGVFEMRLFPFAGAVMPNGSEQTKSRIAGALIAIGGLLAQWIGMIAIGRLRLVELPWLETICITYGFCSFISLLVLIPKKGSDGYYLLKSLKRGSK